ncbi:hypothetical protein EWM64_g6830 [Hericium alpestre]|uniref:Enoyl reductase (ER) domain-containing protein n=1 Tax=Hericium alpestre TaxID=135208 RepID=A0A4Y9ZTN0_9AGAM|nr:hypothetical protein EWM64_g6830 [Hericium alpestre]
MSSSLQQKALILPRKGAPFEIVTRDVPRPAPGEVLVHVHAAVLNPIEPFIQRTGEFVSEWPAILGLDGAGVVHELGDGVTDLKKGDRVLFQAVYAHDLGTLQQYTVAIATRAAKIPENISFDEAATLPTNFATAAIGIYGGQLDPPGVRGRYQGAGYTAPWTEGGIGKYKDQPIVVIGGSSSVGQYAIQLAKLSGFNPIITTASASNEEYCKRAGATHIIDYHTTPYSALPAAVSQITTKPVELVYAAISSEEAQRAALEVVAKGGYVVLTLPPTIGALGEREDGMKVIFVMGSVNVPENYEFGDKMYAALPGLLASGDIKPSRTEVLLGGLAGAPAGVERLANNSVSGVKLVVHPQETL